MRAEREEVFMTKSAWAAVAVWVAAFASLGGVAYALNRPLESPLASLESVEMLDAIGRPATTPISDDVAQAPRIVEMGVVEIVGYVSRPVPRAALPAPPRDIRDMRCTDWRELEQGSPHQRVQICE
jgi:hypothetical protein